MENWKMDLYGLIFENISSEDMLVLGITLTEMSSLISCDAVLNRSKIPVPGGTSILLQFLVKIRPNLAKILEDRTKTASQLINELTSG